MTSECSLKFKVADSPVVPTETITSVLSNIEIQQEDQEISKQSPENKKINNNIKISRNEICPCGSGKKYKHCHGKF